MRPVRDLYGWSFVSVAGGATEWGYMGPIPGVGRVAALSMMFGRLAATPGGGAFRFAWVSTIPASSDDISGGEPLFPQSLDEAGTRGRMWIPSDAGIFRLSGPFEQQAYGRYLGLECLNITADAGVASVFMEWERGGERELTGRRAGD